MKGVQSCELVVRSVFTLNYELKSAKGGRTKN